MDCKRSLQDGTCTIESKATTMQPLVAKPRKGRGDSPWVSYAKQPKQGHEWSCLSGNSRVAQTLDFPPEAYLHRAIEESALRNSFQSISHAPQK